MNLHEGPDDITNVLKEEPEAPGAAGSSAAINANDFSIDSLEVPKTETPAVQEQKPAAAAPAAQAAAPASEVKKETTKTTIGPDGEKIVERTVIQSAPTTEKSEAVARLFNTDTSLLMFNIFLTRFGGIFTPERPREYWSLTTEDRKDLGLLLKESAKEEQWTGIPTKYLLLGAMGLMIGGKVMYAKKLEYEFVPGEKSGDPKAKQGTSGEEKKSSTEGATDYKALFTREKARYEVELGVKNNSEELKELKRKNDLLEQMLSKAAKTKVPGGGVSDADYVMLRKDQHKEEPDPDEPGENMFQDSQGRMWDLATTEFTDQAAIRDKTKAGLSGWSPTGIKLGSVSAGQHEAFAEWKKYRKRNKISA